MKVLSIAGQRAGTRKSSLLYTVLGIQFYTIMDEAEFGGQGLWQYFYQYRICKRMTGWGVHEVGYHNLTEEEKTTSYYKLRL